MEEKKTIIATIASFVPSFLIASCCLGPLIFILTGTSIAWLSGFTALSKYKTFLIIGAFALLTYPFYQLYINRSKIKCDCEINSSNAKLKKLNKILFWLSFIILTIATIYPYLFNLWFKYAEK